MLIRSGYRWLPAVVTVCIAAQQCRPAKAEDKNGVTPNAISRPSGPGSLEGLGDSFQPALNTGTARYAVPLLLPRGIAGFSPQLSLRYDAGSGFGISGIGWSLGSAGVRRQTEKGLPRYDAPPLADGGPDRFLGMDGEELIRLANGYFIAKIAGDYTRYRVVGDHWEAHTKSGIRLEFGVTASARIAETDDANTYQWLPERQTDTNGNVITYEYARLSEPDRQTYLVAIRYGPRGPPWQNSYLVTLAYEPRPDAHSDYRAGFRVRTSLRLASLDVSFSGTLIRRYVLGYGAHAHWSYLTTLTQYGQNGVSTLPITTFGYHQGAPLGGGQSHSALGHVIESTGEPNVVMDGQNVELLDINADGLPDLLQTESGLAHVAYMNRGEQDAGNGRRVIYWDSPTTVAADDSTALARELRESTIHLADMTGDGIADLVSVDEFSVEYYANTGAARWGARTPMAVQSIPPPAPFGPDRAHVRSVDIDFDKDLDIIRSDSGSYYVWYNLGGGAFTEPVQTAGAYNGQQFVDLADAGVDLADINGDRLPDVVKLTPNSVIVCAGLGFGEFDAAREYPLPDRFLDDSPGGTMSRAKWVDATGDGLADLVVERAAGDDLWLWINLGDAGLAPSRVITDLPTTGQYELRWADINGNGTTDLIVCDSTQPLNEKIRAVDLGRLINGTPHVNLLRSIANGYGRETAIHYAGSHEYFVSAWLFGRPWATALPFPSAVVSSVRTSVGLDLDGFADEGTHGDEYATEYFYRDGYYDPLEKQFRGFAFVKEIQRGDERFGGTDAPTMVTRYAFHTGAPDGIDNDNDGTTDEQEFWAGREEEPLKGVELWRERTSLPDDPADDGQHAPAARVFDRMTAEWTVRDLCTSNGGLLASAAGPGYRSADDYGRNARQSVRTVVHTAIIERGNGAVKTLATESDLDAFGNRRFEFNRGDLATPDDDLYAGMEYALNEQAWITDRPSRKFETDGTNGGPGGAFVSDTRHYYDGPAFDGLPLGQVGARGVVHRTESLVSGGAVPPLPQATLALGDPRDPAGSVQALRQQVDDYGNPIVLRDANGNERRVEYDSLMHQFPVRETIVVGGGSQDLVVTATYDYLWGKPLTVTDFNGHVSRFEFDGFGRLAAEYLPGDRPSQPTRSYSYALGMPVSAITATARDNEGGSPNVVTRQYFDGLGRKLGDFELGGPVLTGMTLYNPRGLPRLVAQPYAGGNGDWAPPDPSLPATRNAYDATGRIVRTLTPPDANGVSALHTSEYQPLVTLEFDGEDNRAGGPHHNTPKTLVYDGLNRLIEVREIETLSQVDSGTFITRYRYALPDRLAEITDANGNVKYMRYDGLGRKIFMNDPDRGHMTYTYDAVGNLSHSIDAKSQRINYTYDGANRLLTEDYLDDASPLSFHRTPDVRLYYDTPHPQYGHLFNLRGRLSRVEDLTGGEFRGYDARGNLLTTIKRISQLDGAHQEWSTTTQSDNLDRVYQIIYPDGDVLRVMHDARGLPAGIPNIAPTMTYHSSRQMATRVYANNVTTTWSYDPRLRLTRIHSTSPTETLQDLNYSFDQADNITGIDDQRPLPPGDPRTQTASYVMDNCYRLARAVGAGYGTIEYDYDRLGNMALQTSPDIADEDVNLGLMHSGGGLGTSNRAGRAAGDAPGPHALTSITNGPRPRAFDYDANGNMINSDGDGYVFDFKDRLGRVDKPGHDIRYLYDYSDRRVIKRVDGVQSTYINRLCEVRDGELVKYAFAGETRLARWTGNIAPPPVITQKIPLVAGWNLISFQVDPGTTEPGEVLASIEGGYEAVYGWDGERYTSFVAGAPINTLTSLRPSIAYWLLITENSELNMTGSPVSVPLLLEAGLPAAIGICGFSTLDLPRLFAERSLAACWSWTTSECPRWLEYVSSGPSALRSLGTMVPGAGYWIVANQSLAIPACAPAAAVRRYMLTDHTASVSMTIGDSEIACESRFDPYGRMRWDSNECITTNSEPYGYIGKTLDAESNLNCVEARYLSCNVARFTRVDPALADVTLLMQLEPQRHNAYAYALGRPIILDDHTGESATVGFAITGAIISATTAIVSGKDLENVIADAASGLVSGALSGLVVDATIAGAGVGGILAAKIVSSVGAGIGEAVRVGVLRYGFKRDEKLELGRVATSIVADIAGGVILKKGLPAGPTEASLKAAGARVRELARRVGSDRAAEIGATTTGLKGVERVLRNAKALVKDLEQEAVVSNAVSAIAKEPINQGANELYDRASGKK